VEINPLVVTGEGALMALDAKINIDDNALFAHSDLVALHDASQEDATETAARQVLASLGFRTDAIAGGSAVGFVTRQAIRQAPAGGTSSPRGSTVLVVFAG
jgi:succinyl-CoA synthetase beta subunit